MKKIYHVTGMTCSACSARVEKCVSALDGVEIASVNLLRNTLMVEFNKNHLSEKEIFKAIEDAGYGVATEKKTEKKKSNFRRLVYSLCFLILLMYISMGNMLGFPLLSIFKGVENALISALTQLLLTIPVLIINKNYFKVGFKSLFKGAPNMDSLIAIGSSASFLYGVIAIYVIGYGLGHGDFKLVESYSGDLYFESSAMILTLITLGKSLEKRAKGKTTEAIEKLINLTPKTAFVIKDGEEIQVPIERLAVGNEVIVKAGRSVPADGIITEGRGALDESAITGESMPNEKVKGDFVTGATVCKSGYFKMNITKVGEDTALAQIIKLVEEASSSKAPIARLADKVSGIFVPVVLGIALVTGILWLFVGGEFPFALNMAISVLVISCPCALGLATPTAIMVGTGKAAENGIIFKNAECLETAHSIGMVVLDKTGTLTEGHPSVTDILPIGCTKEELLSWGASIERLSDHPLGDAVVRKAEETGVSFRSAEKFLNMEGLGISCKIDDEKILAGNLNLMKKEGISFGDLGKMAEEMANLGKTPLFFARGKAPLGIIAVADKIKEGSKIAVEELKKLGIQVVMMTGDNCRTAEAIKNETGIERVLAEVLPSDKEKEVRRLKAEGKIVAMVGDGINDAPALASSDVGIAIGTGTDIAIDAADVVLMRGDLRDAVFAIRLSRAVIRNIKQNLFWAFLYNSIGIPLAAGVFYSGFGIKLNPMFGAAAMSLSSVCVVSNALRLKFFGKRKKKEEKTMKREMLIEGMACGHCSARVEKVLNETDGVSAVVDLEKKTAYVTLTKEISDEELKAVVEDAGYQVINIK